MLIQDYAKSISPLRFLWFFLGDWGWWKVQQMPRTLVSLNVMARALPWEILLKWMPWRVSLESISLDKFLEIFFPPISGNRRKFGRNRGISRVRHWFPPFWTQMFFMRVSLFIPSFVPWKSSDRISSDKIRLYNEVRVLEMLSRTTNKDLMYLFMKKLADFSENHQMLLFSSLAAKDRIQCGTGCSEDEHCTLGGFRWHCWILEATRINMLKDVDGGKQMQSSPPKTSISTHHGTGNSLTSNEYWRNITNNMTS